MSKSSKNMVKKVVKRKVPKVEEGLKEETQVEDPQKGDSKPKKKCLFCQQRLPPSYTDVVTLRRFLTDRGRIIPKLRSGLCSKHQRVLTRHIKYARHLALLPFTPKV